MTPRFQPRWLDHAWADVGIKEAPGSASNPRILAYYKDAGHPGVTSDAVAWCAAFVGACLARSDIAATGSLMARSYLSWGETVEEPRLGAIAIFSRGTDPSLGHVGFVVGVSPNTLHILGGNQSDAVTIESFGTEQLLSLRWPLDIPAAPAAARTDGIFDQAVEHIFQMEGGFTDDPYDPGGPTNLGITLATYAAHKKVPLDDRTAPRLRAELRDLPKAIARTIYTERYWRPSCAHLLPPALALMHFDASVNHGVRSAARMLQQALDVEIDGEIGPITLEAARDADRPGALERYAAIRLERYRSLPHFWRFGRGWTRRVSETHKRAVTLLAEPPPPLPTPSTKPKEPSMSRTTQSPEPKWWGNSMTIWGAIITTLSSVLPAIGPLIGVDITGEMIRDLGQNLTQAIQAIGGVIGILLTIAGRMRAVQPLVRRDFNVKF